jgi:hypothetical protein
MDDPNSFAKAVAHISEKEPLYLKKSDIQVKKRLEGDKFNDNLKNNGINYHMK